MSIKFKVRQGGGTSAQPDLANLAEAREGIPVFDGDGTPLIDFAQRWEKGQAGQGSYTYVDVDGSMSYFHRPHAEVKLIEDDSGDDMVIGWGRMEGGNDVGRQMGGRANVGHGTVEHASIQVMDCNIDLRGLPFRTEWSRPAETSWERLQALQLRSLNGTSSTGTTRRKTTNITIDRFSNGHLVTATDPVDMDATDYPIGTTPLDVMEDIFSQWNMQWGVTLHHDGGSTHKCLLVLEPDDNDSFPSDLKISDHLEDWDPDDTTAPVLPPMWRRGAGKTSDNSSVISGLISIYGGTDEDPRSVYVATADSEDDWETWVDVYHDDVATTETQATRRANAILADRKRPYTTPQPSITLNPDQVTLITAGQSIEVKSVVINQGADRNSYKWWRIAEIRWEPLPDGRWLAHLQLGRGRNAGGANGGGGHPQPGSTTPKPAPECNSTSTGTIGSAVTLSDELCALGDGTYTPAWCGDTFCGSSSTGAGYTGLTTVTPGWYYTQIEVGFKYAWYTPGRYLVKIHDSTNALPDIITVIWGPGIVVHGTYAAGHGDCSEVISGTFEVPTGYDRVGFKLSDRAWQIVEGTHQFNEYTPPATDPTDDEFCIPSTPGGGSSPFFARSDDPRFDADDQHLTSLIRERVTNNSGGDLEAGDVVIVDTTFDGRGVTTTTDDAQSEAWVGLITEGGADGEGVVVMWSGVVPEGIAVNIGADTAADGDYLFTSTTAGAAKTETARAEGSFARVVRDDSGDPDYVLWWGVPDMGGGGGSGHTIKNNGTPLTARAGLNFNPPLLATDDSGNNETDVNVDWAEAGDLSTQAFGDATSAGTSAEIPRGDHKHAMPANPVTAHEAASDPHAGYVLESLLDAKGDLIAASADNTPAKVTVGADDTILMADAAQTAGLKWVAAGTPSTQAFGDSATVGTSDTFTRGDHKHAMPADPVTAHAAASDPHTGYVLESLLDAKGDLIAASADNTPAKVTVGSNGDALVADSSATPGVAWKTQYSVIPIALGGAGVTLVTGEVLGLKITVPFKCTPVRWDLFADQSGSVVIDLWKDTYGNFPPANADSFVASDKPTLSSARAAQGNCTGWSTINADDVIAVEIESVTTVTQATLNVIVKRQY